MADQRELSFDEEATNYVAKVLAHINSGNYKQARIVIDKIDDSYVQVAVRRTVSAKTGVYL